MNDLIGFTAKVARDNKITIPIEIRELLQIQPGKNIYFLIDLKKSQVSQEFIGKTVYQCSGCRSNFDNELFDRYGGYCPRCNGQIQEISV